MAIKTGVPIVPIGVQGSFKPFRRVKINIGEPIYYDKNALENSDKSLLTERLMAEIVRLTNEKV